MNIEEFRKDKNRVEDFESTLNKLNEFEGQKNAIQNGILHITTAYNKQVSFDDSNFEEEIIDAIVGVYESKITYLQNELERI